MPNLENPEQNTEPEKKRANAAEGTNKPYSKKSPERIKSAFLISQPESVENDFCPEDEELSPTFLQRFSVAFNNLKPWAKVAVPAFALVVIVAAVGILFSVFHSDIKLDAQIIDLYENDEIIVNYLKFADVNKDILVKCFGITEEQATELLNGEGSWKFYNLKISFKNSHKYPVDIYRLKVEDNGKNGVWLSSSIGGAIGLPAKYEEAEETYVEVLVNNTDMNMEEVLLAVEDLTVYAEYARTMGYDEKGNLYDQEDEMALAETPTMFAPLKDLK